MRKTLYGLNWIGSKGLFADQIINVLPSADTFVDLFCGGCAITHCALLSGKYNRVIANDIKDMASFFKQALEGKIENLYEPVTREEFFMRIKEPKIASCWSFSGNAESYVWNKETEKINLELFNCVASDNFQTRKQSLRKAFSLLTDLYDSGKLNRTSITPERKTTVFSALARVANLSKLSYLSPKLECSHKDYQDVTIPYNSTVYCDIPYIGCATYNEGKFDHNTFYEWWNAQDFPVFVSEYTAPDAFGCIWQTTRRVTSGNINYKTSVEKIFVQKRFQNIIDPLFA